MDFRQGEGEKHSWVRSWLLRPLWLQGSQWPSLPTTGTKLSWDGTILEAESSLETPKAKEAIFTAFPVTEFNLSGSYLCPNRAVFFLWNETTLDTGNVIKKVGERIFFFNYKVLWKCPAILTGKYYRRNSHEIHPEFNKHLLRQQIYSIMYIPVCKETD